MRHNGLRLFVLGLFVCLSTSIALPVYAQTSTSGGGDVCSCWCATPEGAKSIGSQTATQCKAACAATKDASYLLCAADPSGWPVNDVRCFTHDECTDPPSKRGYDGEWDTGANPNCPPETRYCFAKPGTDEVELGVPIGPVKTVKDLETYLQGGFQWLIGIAITVSIVFVMVGGIQYALGGASKGQIGKGKKRILNGVTGLILLLCSVLIVQTVNPQLLRLTVPRLPMIKTVVTSAGVSCEEYLDKKFVVADPSGTCGIVSDVLKDDKGANVAAGTQCMWRTCANQNQQCLLVPGGALCTSCERVVEGELGVGIIPSEAVCSQFVTPTQSINGKMLYTRCGWTKDSDLNDGYELKVTRKGSCAKITIDCRRIDSCEDYDSEVWAQNFTDANPRKIEDVIYDDSTVTCGPGGCGNFGLQTICSENPCNVPGPCEYDGWYDCESP